MKKWELAPAEMGTINLYSMGVWLGNFPTLADAKAFGRKVIAVCRKLNH